MKEYRSPMNPHRYKGQKFTEESQTIPDQSLTMKQIMKRYVRGEALGGKDAIYHDEENGEQEGIRAETMDLVDIQERIEESQRLIKEYEESKAKAKTAKQKKEYDAKIKAAAEKLNLENNTS